MTATPTWTAVAPSNIALVKYWGKRDQKLQWPTNDSLSMTLSKSHTITSAHIYDGACDTFSFQDDATITSLSHPDAKVFKHLAFLRQELGQVGALRISSRNSFPRSCGIASSASGFAALTLAATAAWKMTSDWNELALKGATRDVLAGWARRGSGSACRSLWGGFVHWQAGTSPISQQVKPIATDEHWALCDVIAIISDSEKLTPSSTAHLAAPLSPLFGPRLAGLPCRLDRVLSAIATKDIEALGNEIEAESLEMHAVAMTGTPAVQYLNEETLRFISWVRIERRRGGFPAFFTMDAGANVHVICRRSEVETIHQRIAKEWPSVKTIVDTVGDGPKIVAGEI